ncbi:unnamed protein product [Schistocephalus solidus]|uniref:DUF630 domain-containing protein n=1 Tax=Schistocephalus solidus TaxID=70667 RepID=A0A183STY2_SCHSO|nr:unnamed protein product [Schistocephalus solidus]
MVLTTCAAEDIQGGGLVPAVLHGGVRVGDWTCAVEDCQRELAGFQKTKKVLSNLFGKHKKARQQTSIPPLHPHSKKRAETISDTPSPVAVESIMSTSCHAALPNEGTGPS